MRQNNPPGCRPPEPRPFMRWTGLIVAVVSLILAGLFLIQVLVALDADQINPDQETAGSILLIHSPDSPAGQYRLLQAGLAAAGLAAETWSLPQDPDNAGSELQAAIDRFAEESGSEPSTVWLAASGDDAAAAWRLCCQLEQSAGLILLAPARLSDLSGQDRRNWPADKPLAIFASMLPQGEWIASQSLFEEISAEDVALFPAYQPGALKPSQYGSADGKTWLMAYPALLPACTLISPRVLPDVTAWLADFAATDKMTANNGNQESGRLLISLIFRILLAGLLLCAVPFGLSLAFAGSWTGTWHPAVADPAETRESRLPWLSDILMWLPASALAAGLGWLTAWLTGRPNIWLFLALALLPGCRGWIWLLVCLIRRHWLADIDDDDSRAGHELAPSMADVLRPAGIGGLLLILALILLTALWIWLSFGMLAPPAWPGLVLPALIVVNWPAGLAGTVGRIGAAQINGRQELCRRYPSIWQHLPFLLLPVWAGLTLGWSGLSAALLLLAVQIWSVSLGKATALVSRSPAIGCLLQALAFAAGLLLPPVMQGLSI